MTQTVAFLRAINVGGHNVKMADLRQTFEAMGFADVATFIASGNVIFSSDGRDPAALEHQIETGLQQALGYRVATFLRPTVELAGIDQRHPFQAAAQADDTTLYVAFLKNAPSHAVQTQLLACRNAVDDFHFDQRELFWLVHRSFQESTFSGARLEKMLGGEATVRNISTVRKLAAKYGSKHS